MKNVVKTEVVTIRIPSDLVTQMEKQIEVTEEYANRPDFIITAIRKYIDEYEGFLYLKENEGRKVLEELDGIYDPVKNGERCKTKAEKNAGVLESIKTWKKMYSQFEGEPTRIVIRIPIGFRKRWEDIEECNVPITSYLDFIRLSIIALVKDPDQEIRVILSSLSNRSV